MPIIHLPLSSFRLFKKVGNTCLLKRLIIGRIPRLFSTGPVTTMRITRLEIFGFKSFMERFVLNFDKNMVGVVGPNGCGKSNIVDALCWILGETHAKQLRGNLLDDIIFNGTQAKRPLGMAEVSITVRPDEGWTPALAPVENSLEDELEKAEAIVTDGNQLEPSQEERSGLGNLEIIPGLLGAAEIQLTRRLYRSGESEYFINRVPCRLRDMVELYRLIGLGARGLSIVQQGSIGEIVSKKPIARRELLEEAAGISGIRTRIEAAQRKLEKTGLNISRLTDIIKEVDKQVTFLRRQARRAERRNELKDEIREKDLRLFQLRTADILKRRMHFEKEEGELTQALESGRNQVLVFSANEESFRAESEALEVQLIDKRREKEALSQKLSQEREKENTFRLRRSELENKRQANVLAGSRIEEKREALHNERGRRKTTVEEAERKRFVLFGEKELAQTKLGEIRKQEAESSEKPGSEELLAEHRILLEKLSQRSGSEDLLKTLKAERERLQKKREEIRESIRKKQIQYASLESEVRTLSAHYEALKKPLKESFSLTSQSPHEGEETLLFRLLKVPAELEKAMQALLGERGSYLVTGEFEKLTKEYVAKKSGAPTEKRVGLLNRNVRWNRTAVGLSNQEKQVAPSAKRFLDCITVEESARSLFESMLGNVFVVSSLEEALLLLEEGKSERTDLGREIVAVTEQGEVVTHWGWFATQGSGVSFSFSRIIEERTNDIAHLQEELRKLESESTHYLSLEEEAAQALSGFLAKEEEEKRQLLLEEQRVSRLLESERKREKEHRDRGLWEERAIHDDIKRLATDLATVESTIVFEQNRIEEINKELERLLQEEERLQQEKELLQRGEEELEQTGDLSRADDMLTYQAQIHVLDEALKTEEEKKAKLRLKLSETLHELELARREVSSGQERLLNFTLERERCELELSSLLEEARRTHGEDLALLEEKAALSLLEEVGGEFQKELGELQDQCKLLRSRLEREGEVDSSSIELYQTEEKRLSEMTEQLKDLENAFEILEKTIKRLKTISRSRFLETFHAVNEKFSELVPRLFGGGSGQLELIDPEDPLTSGVELVLRPPGKKIKNLELLSGGEKALAATAVLMAMFLHRPNPLCVLDEVDAPLDEANLERFLELIREISSSTQFLIITHNKQTMAAVDKLIGITMQEKGVSRALSVSLETADRELEQWVANL